MPGMRSASAFIASMCVGLISATLFGDTTFIVPPNIADPQEVFRRRNSCLLMLVSINARLTSKNGADGTAYLGEAKDLPYLLVAAGLSVPEVNKVTSYINKLTTYSRDELHGKVLESV